MKYYVPDICTSHCHKSLTGSPAQGVKGQNMAHCHILLFPYTVNLVKFSWLRIQGIGVQHMVLHVSCSTHTSIGYLWKIYAAETYFTRPPVVTVVTNLNSCVVGGRCVPFWKYIYFSSSCLSKFNHENGSESSHIKRAFTSKSCFVKVL